MLLNVKEQELANYKENVGTYVNLKVSQRSIFGLTLEINKTNQSLINEAMIKFYLNKCLQVDKAKFRFINTEELVFTIDKQNAYLKDEHETPDEEVTVVKIFIEIVDDQHSKHDY